MNLHKSLFFSLLCLFLSAPFAKASLSSPFSKVQLISPYQTLSKKNQVVPIGLLVTLDKGWHSYWLNPGESGKTLKVQWDLHQGGKVLGLNWPLPERIDFSSFNCFGYKKSFLLTSSLVLPPEVLNASLKEVTLRAKVTWFICKEVCIPLQAELSLKWPLHNKEPVIDSHHHVLFTQWRGRQPPDTGKTIVLQKEGAYWRGDFRTQKQLKLLDVFALSNVSPLSAKKPLVADKGLGQHWFRSLAKGDSLKAGPTGEHKALMVFQDKQDKKKGLIYSLSLPKQKSLFWFLILSFLGGILLNLMPCVLPVVFLKFSHTYNEARHKNPKFLWGNVCYSLGVIVSFMVLAFVIVLLKAGGEHIGWGFHLQSPLFVLGLIFVFTAISFGFMGWLSLPSLPFRHKEAESLMSSFLTGVLSTVSATPCTAPFMGAGIGYGFSNSHFHIMLIFLFLGLGLSFPYLLLSVFPKWIRYIPLPGDWSHKLKHFMAFPMLGTAIWLLYVLQKQKPGALFPALISILVVALVFWLLKNIDGRWVKGLVLYPVLVLAFLGPVAWLGGGEGQEYITWDKFSISKMDQIQQLGEPLFVNFTANWCITCKFNERVTFKNKKVVRFFKDNGIRALKGDWTNPRADIPQILERYQRSGIPFYLYIPSNTDPAVAGSAVADSAIVLPELLTPALLLKYLKPPLP